MPMTDARRIKESEAPCKYCHDARLVGWSGAGPILCPECSSGEDEFTVITRAWREQRSKVREVDRENTALRIERDEALAQLRESQAECARLKDIYASAVNGRAEMRRSTVESVERVIAERDAANVKLAEAVELLIAYTRDEIEVREFLATVWP